MFVAIRVAANAESALHIDDNPAPDGAVRVSLGPAAGSAPSDGAAKPIDVDRCYAADAPDEDVWRDLGEGRVQPRHMLPPAIN